MPGRFSLASSSSSFPLSPTRPSFPSSSLSFLPTNPSPPVNVIVLAFTPSSSKLLPSLNGNATPPAVGRSGLDTLPLNSSSTVAAEVVVGLRGEGAKEGKRRDESFDLSVMCDTCSFSCFSRRRKSSAAGVSSLIPSAVVWPASTTILLRERERECCFAILELSTGLALAPSRVVAVLISGALSAFSSRRI